MLEDCVFILLGGGGVVAVIKGPGRCERLRPMEAGFGGWPTGRHGVGQPGGRGGPRRARPGARATNESERSGPTGEAESEGVKRAAGGA